MKVEHVSGAPARGFTLIELMVTVSIAAVLLAVAAPYFSDATLNARLTATANNLVSATTLARSEAIKRNTPVTLCASTDGATCATSGGWEQGWIVTASVGGVASVLHRQQAAAAGLRVSGVVSGTSTSALSIAFPPIGLLANNYSFTLCRATPVAGRVSRIVSLTTTGRVSTTKQASTTCS